MSAFRVALSADFRRPDGSPSFAEFDLSALRDHPDIDLFYLEPESELTLDNVIVTPHALCWTDQLFAASGAADERAVMAVMAGNAPRGIVNRDVVDRPGWQARLADYAQRFRGG